MTFPLGTQDWHLLWCCNVNSSSRMCHLWGLFILLQLIFPINFRFEPRLIPQLIKGSREQPISLRFRRWSYFFRKNNLVDYLPGSFKTQSSVGYIHRAINFIYYQVHPLESLSSPLGATPRFRYPWCSIFLAKTRRDSLYVLPLGWFAWPVYAR